MSTNYLDTVTMFYNCPFDIRILFTKHWVWDDKESDSNLHHFYTKTHYSFLRYYPSLHGYRRLYATFSLPKLYYKSNRNTYNVKDYDNHTFMNRLYEELDFVMDSSRLPTKLSDWQPSRIDLFRMIAINPLDQLEYKYGYGRLTYRGARTTTYKNTNYLPSSVHAKLPCILLRNYNKTVEEQDRNSMLYGNLPSIVEKEHERLMLDMDVPNDKYRFEFMLRRSAIARFCQKYNYLLNMETLMDENVQKRLLNDLVISRGLHYNILCKNEYRRIVSMIFSHKQTIDNALKFAEAIRNKKTIPLTLRQQQYIKSYLNSYYVSTATTNFVNIKGIELLS